MNHIIRFGHELANEFGFTPDKFSSDSYLWRVDDEIIVSLITSKFPGKGNTRALLEKIREKGFSIMVPTPSARMRYICLSLGFEEQVVHSELGAIEAMIKKKENAG